MSASEHFGKSYAAWSEALAALHKFARTDGAPLGVDVIAYFAKRTVEADDAVRARSGRPRPWR